MDTQLAEVASMNDASKALFETFSGRQRFRKHTNVTRLARSLKVDAVELLDTFRHLEKLGLGSVVIGRKKRGVRFMWDYNLKDVARAAKGEINMDEIEPLHRNGKQLAHPYVDPGPVIKARPSVEPEAKNETVSEIILFNRDTKSVKRYRIAPDKEDLLLEMLPIFTR